MNSSQQGSEHCGPIKRGHSKTGVELERLGQREGTHEERHTRQRRIKRGPERGTYTTCLRDKKCFNFTEVEGSCRWMRESKDRTG